MLLYSQLFFKIILCSFNDHIHFAKIAFSYETIPFWATTISIVSKTACDKNWFSNADILGKKETAVSNNSKVKSFEPKLYHF